MKTVYIYSALDVSKNPVLSFYVAKIEESFSALGCKVARSMGEEFTGVPDIVITLDAKAFLYAICRWPWAKHGIWFQGVMPEEVLMSRGNWLYYYFWRCIEFIAYLKADACLVVSRAMKEHYVNKYFRRENVYVVPCLNRDAPSDFTNKNYKKLDFVYAGSVNVWQEFDLMLELFRKIKKIRPDATLSIYTNGIEAAAAKLSPGEAAVLENVDDETLENRLKNYTYGFVLRRACIVNKVSTPTKISTYLSAGVIPIITNAVDFYADVASQHGYLVLENHNQIDSWVDKILRYVDMDVPPAICKEIFTALYNENNISVQRNLFCRGLIGVDAL